MYIPDWFLGNYCNNLDKFTFTCFTFRDYLYRGFPSKLGHGDDSFQI